MSGFKLIIIMTHSFHKTLILSRNRINNIFYISSSYAQHNFNVHTTYLKKKNKIKKRRANRGTTTSKPCETKLQILKNTTLYAHCQFKITMVNRINSQTCFNVFSFSFDLLTATTTSLSFELIFVIRNLGWFFFECPLEDIRNTFFWVHWYAPKKMFFDL